MRSTVYDEFRGTARHRVALHRRRHGHRDGRRTAVSGNAPEPAALRVPASVLDELIAHARAEAPRECCGLLIGRRGEINRAFRARNARRGTTRYLIDPRDHFAAIRAAREAGAEVVGYYHSHPASAPQPSAVDRQEAVPGPHYYVLVSLAGAGGTPSAAAYWLLDGNFRPVPLVRVG
jgi:proteasome lid subunit RPN8/RPN11